MAFSQIPLNLPNQKFIVRLGKHNFKLQVIYRIDTFYLDIFNSKDDVLITALPLVQGIDLLEQYQHLIKGSMYVLNSNKDERHNFFAISTEIGLYWEDV